HRQETPGGDTLVFHNILESIPACQAGDRDSIPRRGDSACPFIFLLPWVESKKGQEESQLHWPGIEPGPPAWQARILPLNPQCAPHTEKNGRKRETTKNHRAVAKGSTEKKGRKMRNHQDRAVAKGSTEKNG